MKVAFYDRGNLKEKDAYGLGIIYDNNGALIVAQNEKIQGEGNVHIGWTDRPYTFGSLIVRLCDVFTGVEAEREERMYQDISAWLWMRETLGYNIIYVGDYP